MTQPTIPQILRELGFENVAPPPSEERLRRVFISSEGDHSTGKTRFIGTAPGPVIAVLDFDRGLEGVLDLDPVAAGDKVIFKKVFPAPDFDEEGSKSMSAGERKLAVDTYGKFKDTVEKILKAKLPNGRRAVDTLAIDNCGDPYVLAQMARFGKYAKVGEVPAEAWTSMQMEFEALFRMAYDNNTNLIVTHRQGGKYRGMLGEKELKGYKRMSYVSQVHLAHEKFIVTDPVSGVKEMQLQLRVIKSRQRLAIEDPGHPQNILRAIWLDDEKTQSCGADFIDVVTAVLPNTTERDWFGG